MNNCRTSAECPAEVPICGVPDGGATGGCRVCAGNDECGRKSLTTPKCMNGMCVACDTATCAQPGSKTPVCDNASGSCVRCSVHSDCGPNGICTDDGSCAAADQIAWVDNGGMATTTCQSSGTAHDGKMAATAYCDIQNAIDATDARPYLIVNGQGTGKPYGPVQVTGHTVTMVALGAQAAAIHDTSSRGVLVLDGANVTLDGFDIQSTAGDGVACKPLSGSATLRVRHCTVHQSAGFGVLSNGCTVTLDRNSIGPNNSVGGVSLAAGMYTVTNNFIFSNGVGVGGGVVLAVGATGTFAFNTVARNATTGGVGGVNCASSQLVEASIVSFNTLAGAPASQLSAGCRLINVVTDIYDTQGITSPPVFASGVDYHLDPRDPMNAACCINQISGSVDGGLSMLPLHDFDGDARPINAKWDIGADEVN
jgi:hypothetical protein